MFERPDYTEHIGDKRLEARVRRHYGEKIAALEALGFEFASVCTETANAGVIFFVFALLYQLIKRDALTFSFPKRLTSYQPLLFHEATGCYATVSSFGVNISAYFVDGRVLIVTNSSAVWLDEDRVKKVPEKNYCYYAIKGSIEDTWQVFQRRLAEVEIEGHTLKLPLNFEDYTRIEYRNLEANLGIKGIRK
jgi:hypothetical protein